MSVPREDDIYCCYYSLHDLHELLGWNVWVTVWYTTSFVLLSSPYTSGHLLHFLIILQPGTMDAHVIIQFPWLCYLIIALTIEWCGTHEEEMIRDMLCFCFDWHQLLRSARSLCLQWIRSVAISLLMCFSPSTSQGSSSETMDYAWLVSSNTWLLNHYMLHACL